MADAPQKTLLWGTGCGDCAERRVALPRPFPEIDDDFDWMVRDYDSFRLFMMEELAHRFPGRHRWGPADLEVVIVEALAAALDRLSHTLDVIAAEKTLATATTQYNLPFIDPPLLARWHQLIVEQLVPNAPVRTIQIYAQRLGITADAFAAKLNDPQWLQSQLFDRVPLEAVEAIFDQALDESVRLINAYL